MKCQQCLILMTKLLLFPFLDAMNFLSVWKQSKKDSEPVTLLLHDAWLSGAFFEKLTLSKSRYLCSSGPCCPMEWEQRSEFVLDVHIPIWIFIDYARFCAELMIITAWVLPCKRLVKINDPGKNLHFLLRINSAGRWKGGCWTFRTQYNLPSRPERCPCLKFLLPYLCLIANSHVLLSFS